MREGPRTPSRTADENLDFAFIGNALVFVVIKIGWTGPPCNPPLLPPNSITTQGGYEGIGSTKQQTTITRSSPK